MINYLQELYSTSIETTNQHLEEYNLEINIANCKCEECMLKNTRKNISNGLYSWDFKDSLDGFKANKTIYLYRPVTEELFQFTINISQYIHRGEIRKNQSLKTRDKYPSEKKFEIYCLSNGKKISLEKLQVVLSEQELNEVKILVTNFLETIPRKIFKEFESSHKEILYNIPLNRKKTIIEELKQSSVDYNNKDLQEIETEAKKILSKEIEAQIPKKNSKILDFLYKNYQLYKSMSKDELEKIFEEMVNKCAAKALFKCYLEGTYEKSQNYSGDLINKKYTFIISEQSKEYAYKTDEEYEANLFEIGFLGYLLKNNISELIEFTISDTSNIVIHLSEYPPLPWTKVYKKYFNTEFQKMYNRITEMNKICIQTKEDFEKYFVKKELETRENLEKIAYHVTNNASKFVTKIQKFLNGTFTKEKEIPSAQTNPEKTIYKILKLEQDPNLPGISNEIKLQLFSGSTVNPNQKFTQIVFITSTSNAKTKQQTCEESKEFEKRCQEAWGEKNKKEFEISTNKYKIK